MNKIVLTIIVLISLSSTTFAQRGWEVGGYVGLAEYFGDLNTEFRLNKPGPALGLIGRRNFNTRVSTALTVNYARLRADDADSGNSFEQMRNLSFFNNVFSANLHFEFNFFNYVHGSRDEWFTPFIFAGFGIERYNPKREFAGQVYELREYGTEGQAPGNEYGNIAASMVAGIGLKWDINLDWSFNLHLKGVRVATDYLDDVSTVYPDLNLLQTTHGDIGVSLADPSGIDGFAFPGRQRGTSNTNDQYLVVGIGIMKYFGYLPCPKISEH